MQRILLFVLACSMVACGTRNIRPGDLPQANDGVVYVQMSVTGVDEAKVFVFKAGSRLSGAARFDALAGEGAYAVYLTPGTYEIGDLHVKGGAKILRNSECSTFTVYAGQSTYANSISLNVDFPWFDLKCTRSAQERLIATQAFRLKYPEVSNRFPSRED